MVKTAGSQLQQQIEEVRREAFAAGFAAAMQVVRNVASRSPSKLGAIAEAPGRRGQGRARQSASSAQLNGSRGVRANVTVRRSAAHRSQRGSNAVMVEEVLKDVRPRAVRPSEIRKLLQKNGITISFPSLGYALRQLEARHAAKQVGNSRTWRHRVST
jgi:hypothetical protein